MVFARFDDLLQAKHGVSAIAHLLTEVCNMNISYYIIMCNESMAEQPIILFSIFFQLLSIESLYLLYIKLLKT